MADEVDEARWHEATAVGPVGLVLAAGDLPFPYLEHLMEGLDAPLVFVPGNHDRGFAVFHDLVAKVEPRLLVHGHVPPVGRSLTDLTLGTATVRKVVGHRGFTIDAVARPSTCGADWLRSESRF
jgi:hypothetical protein